MAAKIPISGINQETPKLSPVQPAATTAAKIANGLRMAGYRSPDQLQFQPVSKRDQSPQSPAHSPLRRLTTMGTTFPGGLPVRPIGVFSTRPALHNGFHSFSFFLAVWSAG